MDNHSLSANQDVAPLAWVIDEIRVSLNAAVAGANTFFGNKQDSDSLRNARNQVHQAHGALQLLDLRGVSLCTDAVEQAMRHWESDPKACSLSAVRAIENALHAVLAYLDGLLAGRPNQPIRLFPYYREVQAFTGATRIHPADLVFPDLSRRPAFHEIAQQSLTVDQLKVRRQRFEEGLLGFLRNSEDARARRQMRDALADFETLPLRGLARSFWWIVRGVAEALDAHLLPVDIDLKRVLARLNLQLRRQIEGGGQVAERLMTDALYYVARADDKVPRVGEIKRLYGLDALVPADFERPTLTAADVDALRVLKEALGQAKTLWAQGMSSASPDVTRFIGEIRTAREAATRATAASLEGVLAAIESVAPQIRPPANTAAMGAHEAVREGLGLEVASALLFIELGIDQLPQIDTDADEHAAVVIARLNGAALGQPLPETGAWMSELARRAQDRLTMQTVVAETQATLRDIETRLDRFFRNPAERGELAATGTMFDQVCGVLSMLGFDDPVRALRSVQDTVSTFAEPGTPAQPAEFARIAQNLGAIGFFVETLDQDSERPREMFRYDPVSGTFSAHLGQAATEAGSLEADEASMAMMSAQHAAPPTIDLRAPGGSYRTENVEASARRHLADAHALAVRLRDDPFGAADRHQLSHLLPLLNSEADLLDDADLKRRIARAVQLLAAARDGDRPDLSAELANVLAPPAPTALPELTAPLPASEAAVGSELLDIFLEEAREVLEALAHELPQLRAMPDDPALMTAVRRAFHTLKGSSRMVKLTQFGDGGWALEQCFNLWMSREQPATTALLDLAELAAALMGQWIAAIEGDPRQVLPVEPLIQAAARVRDGGPLAYDGPLPETDWPATQKPQKPQKHQKPQQSPEPRPKSEGSGSAPQVETLPPVAPQDQAPRGAAAAARSRDGDEPLYIATAAKLAFSERTPQAQAGSAQATERIALTDATAGLPMPAEGLATAVAMTTPLDFELSDPDEAITMPLLEEAPDTLFEADLGTHAATLPGEQTAAVTPPPMATSTNVALQWGSASAVDTGRDDALASHWPAPSEATTPKHTQAPVAEAPVAAEVTSANTDPTADRPRPILPTRLMPPAPPASDPAPDPASDPASDPALDPLEELLLGMTRSVPVGGAPALSSPPASQPVLTLVRSDPAPLDVGTQIDLAEPAADAAAALPLAADDHPVAPGDLMAPWARQDETRRIGSLEISHGLYSVFLNEADECVRALRREFEEWRFEPAGVSSRTAVRASHSLAGISATVGLQPVWALADPLDDVVNALSQGSAPPAPEPLQGPHFDVLDAVVARIGEMLRTFAAGSFPDHAPDLEQAMAALASRFQGNGLHPLAGFDDDHEHVVLPPDTETPDRLASQADPGSADPWTDRADDAAEGRAAHAADAAELTPPSDELAPAPAAGPTVTLVNVQDSGVRDELDDDLLQVFLTEAGDQLPAIGEQLRALQANRDDREVARELMRRLHTVKGSARMAGAMRLGELVHAMETRIEEASQLSAMPVTVADDLLAQHDQAMALFDRLVDPQARAMDAAAASARAAAASGQQDADDNGVAMPSSMSKAMPVKVMDTAGATELGGATFAAELKVGREADLAAHDATGAPADARRAQQQSNAIGARSDATSANAPGGPPQDGLAGAARSAVVASATQRAANAPAAAAAAAAVAAAQAFIRVRADVLDKLVDNAGEVSISRAKLENEVGTLRTGLTDLTENIARLRLQLREVEIQADAQMQARTDQLSKEAAPFDPLEFDRYSRLQELTRLLAESVEDVAMVQSNMLKGLQSADSDLTAQSRLTRELQQQLMRVRLVPFSNVAERLYRVARQAAKETDKRIALDIRGGTTEIDRGVLERMAGPFEHLVRNAIVHGLELPAQRLRLGKPETGELKFEVRQDGNEIVVVVSDDGSGLDLERIRARAIEKKLIGADQPMGERELMDLIFAPGFSTLTEVTELAGRGVGMDVVRSELSSFGGRVTVTSESGQGARFTLYLPLTLAVAQVVLATVNNRRYAIPAGMVEQLRRYRPQQIELALSEGVLNIDPVGDVVVRPLAQLLGDELPTSFQKQTPVVLLRSGEDRLAVVIDDLSSNQEVVVKNIGAQVSRLAGILGATILGNGEIVLIVNPVQLISRAPEPALPSTPPSAAALAAGSIPMTEAELNETAATIMVVDDSLTVRRVTQRLLERQGWTVVLAKDGVDALRQLQDVRPDVMLVDIEMPRMDGFDLTRNIRSTPLTQGIPIIMITSRTAEKHRNVAIGIGVNEYLGKPYQEAELLALIRRYLALATVAKSVQ